LRWGLLSGNEVHFGAEIVIKIVSIELLLILHPICIEVKRLAIRTHLFQNAICLFLSEFQLYLQRVTTGLPHFENGLSRLDARVGLPGDRGECFGEDALFQI
jgi:hypothetical protein